MPRRKSPCGTYPAYRRHLDEKTPVDDACRRAQRENDARRSRSPRTAAVRPARVSVIDPRLTRRDELERRFRVSASDLCNFVEDRYLYGVIDLFIEMEELIVEWMNAEDDVEPAEGWRDMSGEVLAMLRGSRDSTSTRFEWD